MPSRKTLFKSLHGEGAVALVVLRLTVLKDGILPPFTSRTLKSIAAKARCLETVWTLYESAPSYKPVSIRVLRTSSMKPMYRVERKGNDRPFIVKRGHILFGYLAFYTRESLATPPLCNEDVDIDYTAFHVETEQATFRRLDSLGKGDYSRVKIEFVTPVTITTKIMAPPLSSTRLLEKLLSRTREAYRLLPSPGYIAAQAARVWVALASASNPRGHHIPYAVGRLADIMVAEVDFWLRPETVVYGREDGDKLRKVRGVRGYVVYEPLNDGIKYDFSRLLDFASYMGIGKSRSIGFGEIRVEYI
ncbi:CRISPR system precrRNA processing endoribonuclease RAMP protein Cas6 [Aeropyrum camini]|uniref:CRISPR-associated protein Cas6 C-terminal domain-containing protein n=1 Tax=Aeropyrum camini SY1 = JCM 12091 TaxID=1198449 RepID=U3TBM7_9CREN|nr:CRISPR system precrRNA processing endoribonuclease RAMP protein Cas6 [Aeropyrum camini]BAN89826.1 hypothetical protein ACAM_0357 [Aeropyrum camini SY1 = JCM 12091]